MKIEEAEEPDIRGWQGSQGSRVHIMVEVFSTRIAKPVVIPAAIILCCMLSPYRALAVPNGGSDTVGCSHGASKTWYFAEGTTRSGFNEYVCLLNPTNIVSIADFSYMLDSGETLNKRYDLLPASRTTINVMNEIPAKNDVSIKINASEPVVAERSSYFVYKNIWSGGHVVLGATEPKPDWYFAEGTTRDGFDTYLCLQNPGDLDASVDVEYFLVNGANVSRRGVRIKPRSRFTIAAYNDDLGIGRHNNSGGDFSVRVRTAARTPIVAERATYFNYRPFLNGGHDVLGANAARTDWYFAEGSTRSGFDTYLCLANPGAKDAKVDVSYLCGDGKEVNREGITVGRSSRLTIAAYDDNLGIGRHDDAHGDFSTTVHSTNGVTLVAERVSYFFYRPFWSGGHAVVGASAPALRWYFSEGCTRHGFDTYLCLANPSYKESVVDVTYYLGDNQVINKPGITVPPRCRFTIDVHNNSLGIGRRDDAGGDVSMKIQSANGVPVVAERPMYFAERWRTMDRMAIASAWGWGEAVHGNVSRPYVALTFDCETNDQGLRQILDILEQKGVHATFFLLGNIPARYPDVVERIADGGHEIGNHGATHPQFTKISPERVASELGSTESAVNQLTGFTTKPYFRFPDGARNTGLIAQVNSLGYLSIFWSVDPQDWRGSNSVQAVIDTVVGRSGPGAIVLMHDRPKTVAALPAVIDGLRARGFALVTLTELLCP